MSRIDALLSIMARLRDPDGGCPWDLEQDFASISPHTIEEAYEVDEAIASGDLEALRDELGDLLFQVVFQARLAEEADAFDFEAVVEAIVDKLVRRHPHVFAHAETPPTVEAQLANWEEIKAAERAAAGRAKGREPDPFVGIPRSLPALSRSAKIAGRVEQLAIATDDERPGRDVREALEQLAAREHGIRQAVASSASGSDERRSRDETTRALGEGLRAWVQLARTLGIDPERALREVDDDIVASIRANRLEKNAAASRQEKPVKSRPGLVSSGS